MCQYTILLLNEPGSTVKVLPFHPRPLINSPSGKFRVWPLSSMYLRSYKQKKKIYIYIVELYFEKNYQSKEVRSKINIVVYRVVSLKPITNQKSVISSRWRERNGYLGTTQDPDSTEPTGRLVESKRREVIVGADLIFHLKYVCEVSTRGYRACRAVYTILK